MGQQARLKAAPTWSLALLLTVTVAGCSATAENPGTGAVNTGTYPNLNIKPGVAAEQFSPQERAAKGAALQATRASAVNSGGTVPADRHARLQELARTHAKKTLDEIEKGDCSPRPTCE